MVDFCGGKLGRIEHMMKQVPELDKYYVDKEERDCPYRRYWKKKIVHSINVLTSIDLY